MDKYIRMRDVPKGKRLSHFWYYYKWPTILTVVILILGGMFIKDVFFKERMDVSIMVTTTYNFTYDYTDQMAEDLKKYAEDYNDNGKLSVVVTPVNYPANANEVDADTLLASQVKMIGELQSDGTALFVFNDPTLELMEAEEVMVDFTTVLEGSTEGLFRDNNPRRIYLKDIPIFQDSKALPDDVYLTMRTREHFNPKDKEKLNVFYDGQIAFLNHLIQDTPVQ